jgi:hypothetical protein
VKSPENKAGTVDESEFIGHSGINHPYSEKQGNSIRLLYPLNGQFATQERRLLRRGLKDCVASNYLLDAVGEKA